MAQGTSNMVPMGLDAPELIDVGVADQEKQKAIVSLPVYPESTAMTSASSTYQ